jgi:hypothetical protein
MSKENMPSDQNPSYKLKIQVQKLFPDFTDSVDGLSIEDLKKNVVIYSSYKEESEIAKARDEELNNAKELVKELSGPYNDTLGALKKKLSYIHALLTEKKTE